MINIEELLGKVGFRPVIIKSGRYKDIGSSTRPMTDEERAILQRVVDQLHQQFVLDLSRGRRLEVSRVAALADGRIFSGQEAIRLGLADQIGNFHDAVNLAKQMSGLKGKVRLIYPDRKPVWWKQLLTGKSPIHIWPEWIDQPVRFQYLYLPGL